MVMANLVLGLRYGKWIYCRCAGLKRETHQEWRGKPAMNEEENPPFSGHLSCIRFKVNIGEAVE